MKTGAVIVTYNIEDYNEFCKNLDSLAAQVSSVCIVDNSASDNGHIYKEYTNVKYIPLLKNVGIAAAQNTGIQNFIDSGYDYIVFSDQDSRVPPHAIEQLVHTYLQLEEKGYKPGSVGSRAYNKQTQQPYPHSINFIKDFTLSNGDAITEVTYTMNSISLISIKHFKQFGLMDEGLFIDGVDSEWCWRAGTEGGVRFYVNENVHIMHLLGLGNKTIGNRSFAITPPYRMFYQYRNYLWLSRRKYTPWKWIIHNGIKYLAKIFYYGIFSKDRVTYLRNILKGINKGLKQQTINI